MPEFKKGIRKMNIVITMAGLGTRFKKAGYEIPKYKIQIKEKTLFEWSMESLKGFEEPSNQYFFIARKADESKEFIEERCHNLGIRNITIIEIDHVTKGQAETVMKAKNCWDRNEPLFIYNIDTYIEAAEMNSSQLKGDGFIPCFKGAGDHWSFVRLDDTGIAVEVREKKRISEYCSVGAYYFRSAKLFEELYTEFYTNQQYLEAGEQYVAPIYNLLLNRGGKVFISDIPTDKVHILGTPEEVELFKNS